jgi:hypothetical protein
LASAQLVLKRYGDKSLRECAAHADEIEAAGDDERMATWRQITDAVGQLANEAPAGPVR